MIKKFPVFLVAAAAGALVLASATAAGQSSNPPVSTSDSSAQKMKSESTMKGSHADSHFVMEAAKGGLAEVEKGRLAADKASSADVKQFGQRMVDDHSKANDELKSVASQKGITLPTELDAKDKAMVDKLSKLSGDAFDKAYMTDMVKDHKTDVADFKKEANHGKDADVKSFASKTLPTLEEHLRMAEDIHSKMGGTATHKGGTSKASKTSNTKSSGQ